MTGKMTDMRPANADSAPEMSDRQRVRIVYEKGESIKFISHQDEFRAWERALRRSGLPMLYKQGFNPQPHMQFASPLGVGFSGRREIVDIIFSPPVALGELQRNISACLPPGLRIHSLSETDLKETALQTLLIGADYRIEILASADELAAAEIEARIADFLATDSHLRTRERKGRTYQYNLRPLVYELRYEGYDPAAEVHSLFLRVQQREGATGRPDEVVSTLNMDGFARNLWRERLYFTGDAEDEAEFASYIVASKEEVAMSPAPRSQAQRPRRDKGRTGSTIGERAADEFA